MVVYLVGAGPEADLLTLRGASLIEKAAVIIYTDGSARDILRLAKNPNCEIIDAERQEKDVQRELVEKHLQKAKTLELVRLIHGDPLSSFEGARDVEFLSQNNIPFEIVPGVLPLLSALSMAGILPLTEEKHDFAIVRVPETAKDILSFKHYSEFVVLASGARTKETTQNLLKAIKAPKNQKVAILRNYGTLDQVTEFLEVGDLEKELTIWPQDLVVVSKTPLERSKELSWFEAKRAALKGQKIGFLWPGARSGKVSSFLEQLGAKDIDIPLVKVESIAIRPPLLEKFGALVFPTAEIIPEFFNRVDVPQDKLFFALGPEGQYALEQQGVSSKIPVSYTPRGLASLVLSSLPKRGRILIISNSDFSETLRESLSESHIIWEINLYNVKPVDILPDLSTCTVLVASSTSVIEPLSEHWSLFGDKIVISAGPTITRALFERGLSPTLEAKHPTPMGIIHSLIDYLYRNQVSLPKAG